MTESTFQQMFALVEGSYPNYAGAWSEARTTNGGSWEKEISERIALVFGSMPNDDWREAVDGYAEFCTDALRAQVFFERHGRYPESDYDTVVAACYADEDYMNRRYLPGQYLSHYIWPHHFRMLSRYRDVLLGGVSSEIRNFYEVGVGCGMYSLQTLLRRPECRGIGFDISPFSTAFTARVVKAHGLADRYETRTQDAFVNGPSELADLVISQEVLEHLPDPANFVAQLRSMTRPDGWGYITAAINAAHTDHIYLYRSPNEVVEQLERAGWVIVDKQIESNYPEKPEQFRPTIAGFLVQNPA